MASAWQLVLELIALAVLGLGVGCYGTIIGAGGGFILVPVLLIFYPDEEPNTLTAISLFVVFVNAVSGSIAYWRQRRIDYLTGLFFAACSVPGVVAGAVLVNFVPGRLFTAAFGLMLLALAALSWQSRAPAVREPLRGAGVLRREISDTEGRRYVYAYRTGQAAVLSLGIGFISSLFGIGGGVIQVPAMIIMLHIPAMFATATSLFTLSFMSGGATFIHLVSGTLSGEPLARAAALAVGAVPGAQIGAVFAQRIKPRYLLILLAVSISILGVRLLLKAIFNF